MNITHEVQIIDDEAQQLDKPRNAAGRHVPDADLNVKFYIRPIKHEHKSEIEGRPIYEDVEFVLISNTHDKNSSLDIPVTEIYRKRFPVDYQHFKNKSVAAISGTPLEAGGFIPLSTIAELKSVNVRTIEQLAGLTDAVALQYSGVPTLRQKAVLYLELTANEEVAAKRKAEADAKQKEWMILKAQVAMLLAAQTDGRTQPKVSNSSGGL